MLTIKIIHEVNWLPNDVESKLDAILALLEGRVQEQINTLANRINQSSDKVEDAIKEVKGDE